MTDSQRQIRDRVATMARERRARPVMRSQDIQISDKDKAGFLGVFLITCIILLSIAIVPIMYRRLADRNGPGEPVMTQRDSSQNDTNFAPIPDGQQGRQETATGTRLSALEDGYKAQQHRLWLLAIANNENAHLMDKMDEAHHRVDDRGFITFDSEWNMSKMPETMNLTQDQRDRIENGPR